jgi:hypothetical protein
LLRCFFVDRYLAITPNEAKEVGGNIWFNQENGLYLAGYVSTIVYSLLPTVTITLFFKLFIGLCYLALLLHLE